eukprot:732369-Pyramimonas_sp.AAC.1
MCRTPGHSSDAFGGRPRKLGFGRSPRNSQDPLSNPLRNLVMCRTPPGMFRIPSEAFSQESGNLGGPFRNGKC